MHARTRALVTAFALALGLAGRSAAQTSLASDSPFKPAGTAAAPAATPNDTVEFSGVMVGDKTLVIIYDKVAKKGRVIPVGGTVDGIEVIGYDPRREQVSVKVGGEQKLLTLRKSTAVAGTTAPAQTAANNAMNFNVPTPPSAVVAQKIEAVPPPTLEAAGVAITPAPVAPTPAKPEEPAKPVSIARQEEEARMLVSDLLEIGMAQRKAYEEKQRAAATAEQAGASTPPARPNNGG